jgi:hypothetical protein
VFDNSVMCRLQIQAPLTQLLQLANSSLSLSL